MLSLNRKSKVGLIAASLALGLSGTALAASEGADSFSDVPKDHWSYEALDMLAKNGVIEGYGDGTFRGGRTMTRYEMAAIVSKAAQNKNLGIGDQAIVEKMQREFKREVRTLKQQVSEVKKDMAKVKAEQERVKLYGFVRAQWQNDNRNEGEPYQDQNANRRYMLNLKADLKINPEWTGHFEIESKQHYTHPSSGGNINHEDGTIKRVWLDGKFKNGLEITAGRRWTPLGTNFTLLGCDTNGIEATMPITKNGLRAGAFYYTMDEYPNADFSFWGPMVRGPIGHNFDIYAAYARLSKGKGDALNTPWSDNKDQGNWIGNQAMLLGFGTNVAKNLRLSADYVRTNHSYDDAVHSGNVANMPGDTDDNNQAFVAKLDYKWTNPDVVGSFGAYIRYHYIGRSGTIWNDDNDGLILRNSKGWTIGFKYVPWKNVVWGVDYTIADAVMAPWINDNGGHWADSSYKRRTIRTTLDYHF